MKELNIDELIQIVKASFVKENSEGVDTCIQANLTGAGGGQWYMRIKDQMVDIQTGAADDARAVVKVDSKDFLGLLSGELDPIKAFITGKIKIIGDQSAVIKMVSLFRVDRATLQKMRE
jgi:putative sterol carrier protein